LKKGGVRKLKYRDDTTSPTHLVKNARGKKSHLKEGKKGTQNGRGELGPIATCVLSGYTC